MSKCRSVDFRREHGSILPELWRPQWATRRLLSRFQYILSIIHLRISIAKWINAQMDPCVQCDSVWMSQFKFLDCASRLFLQNTMTTVTSQLRNLFRSIPIGIQNNFQNNSEQWRFFCFKTIQRCPMFNDWLQPSMMVGGLRLTLWFENGKGKT